MGHSSSGGTCSSRVTLNNKAPVSIQPPMFGRDDPLSRLRPLPERFRGFVLRSWQTSATIRCPDDWSHADAMKAALDARLQIQARQKEEELCDQYEGGQKLLRTFRAENKVMSMRGTSIYAHFEKVSLGSKSVSQELQHNRRWNLKPHPRIQYCLCWHID